jgi:1-acyl-sn-glycerol-3-phosphate acyltransferase
LAPPPLSERALRRQARREFPEWPRWRPVWLIRRFLFALIVLPVARIGYRMEVVGRDNLEGVKEPCLIISNHNMHLDQSILLRAMPTGFRQRVAIAAAASDIFGNRARGFCSALLGNAFPFAKEGGGIRDSLDHVQRMLGDGWHILIFPEGKLTVVGPMQPFKGGIGLLARETNAPVLPIRIDVLRPGAYEGRWWPHPRARVRVSIGEPIRIAPRTNYAIATARLEEAVRCA